MELDHDNSADSTASPTELPGDCYSAGERSWMESTQRWRGRLLLPLLQGLTRCRITPDQLTLVSLIVGVGFVPLWTGSPIIALLLLAGHVILDGVDGPLARHQGVASHRGSFTDSMVDQIVLTLVTLTLMHSDVVSPVAGGVFITLYGALVGFAMVRNALAVPYSWLIRPRFVFYCWVAIELWLWPESLDGMLWVCNILLAIKCVTGFLRIRARLA